MNILNKTTKIFKFKTILLYAALILCCVNIFGQSITWEMTYLYSPYVRGYSVKQTADGNYIICGDRTNHGGFILKLNPFGDTLWLRENFPVNEMYSIIEANDGNYVALGHRVDFNTEYLFLVKIAPSGDTLWTRYISEPGYGIHPLFINNTNDNNFIIAGTLFTYNPTTRSAYYIKIDIDGNRIWSKFIGPQTGNKTFFHVKQLSDNGYILTGSTFSGNYTQIYLVRTNSDGDSLWSKEYGNINYFESGNSVFQTHDKGFLVIGKITYSNQDIKIYLVKTDSLGNLEFSKIFGDTNIYYGIFNGECAVKNNFQNSYLVTGLSTNVQTLDTFKVFLLNLDSLGNRIWENTYKKDTLDITSWGIDNCIDSGFIICGNAYSTVDLDVADPYSLLYVLKTTKYGTINPNAININQYEIPTSYSLKQNFPNPFNPSTIIEYNVPKFSNINIKIYNVLGQELETLVSNPHKPGIYKIVFNGSKYASGIYFVRLDNNLDYFSSIKIVLTK